MKLSVITINYNNRDGLRKTIESVVNQTCKDFEYVIIDGGSTDGSVDVIKEYADRINYWVSEPDKGIYNAMNKGIDVAQGEYCLFLNSGDYLFDNYVLSEVALHLDGTDVITGCLKLDTGEFWYAHKEITLSLLYKGFSLSHPASFIKTNLLKELHYDENLKIVSDWKFFIQIFIYSNSTYKPLNCLISIFDTSGISSTNTKLCLEEQKFVLRNSFPKRVYDYFADNTVEVDVQLYNIIRESQLKRCMYTFNVIILKILYLFKKHSWVSKFPFTN